MNRQNAPPYIGSFNSRTIHRKNVAIKLDARTEQEALDDILRFAEENGRAPTYADFEKACVYGENYSSETICRHFDKTWNEILTDLGLDMSTAINVFLNQIVYKQAIPFEISKPVKKIAKLGGWEGKISMSADFNEPMEEFGEYMQ